MIGYEVVTLIIKEMFYIPIKLKPELVNNQWRSNFQQQIV